MGRIEELEEYITDLEEELENLSEHNRLLVIKVKELEGSTHIDLISRTDALSCFHDWIDKHGDVHTADEMPEFQRIEQLPSAEPEIIRCKDCKHSFLHDNGERISRICGLTRMCGTTPDNWYCADAERRADE